MINKGMFTSRSDECETPDALYQKLNRMFGPFTLDPCASKFNAKCVRFYTVHDDGLSRSWSGETVFMNPPHGRVINQWVAKAYVEAQKGAKVVCLLPARTDTKWWHDYVMKSNKVFLIKGRVKFLLPDGKCTPIPSAVVVMCEGIPIPLFRALGV